ncbi:fucolectin-like [Branchiostoma lanceolatum]|uniref:fucolectin-like n=1 Tax=Branchiostoma lanceolatum TaxID=7740 RepID=UPI003454ECB6
MRGRYVGVRLPGPSRTLSLCEVQVFVRTSTPAVDTTCADHTSITTSTDMNSNKATPPFVKTELAQKESINDVAAPKSSIQKEPPHRTGINLARKKTAYQTSTAWGRPASYAVDGNIDSASGHQSCTDTNVGVADPSWWVDLRLLYRIDRVVIFPRRDACCWERINPFNIHIGLYSQISMNHKCGGDHRIDVNQSSITVSCRGMWGRYVGVRLPGPSRTLSLCEVQVFDILFGSIASSCNVISCMISQNQGECC